MMEGKEADAVCHLGSHAAELQKLCLCLFIAESGKPVQIHFFFTYHAGCLYNIGRSVAKSIQDLPAPDSVFLGGSGGMVEEILQLALQKNPYVRVVINAITLETVAAATQALNTLGFVDVMISQIAVSRAKRAGKVHMMLGQNPVYILSGQGAGT